MSSDGWFGRAWLHPAVVATTALTVAAGFSQFGVTAVLGDVASTFGASTPEGGPVAEVGLSATTLGLGLAVIRLAGLGSLPAASMADRRGRRLILWLVGSGLVLTVVAATMPTFWAFVAAAALARPLLAGSNTVATVVVAERTTAADRTKAIALAGAGYSVGSGLVAIAHGVGTEAMGFRGVLALSAVFLLALPWVARRLAESPLFERAVAEDDAGAPGVVPKRLGRIHEGLRGRAALMAVLAFVVAVATGPGFTFLFVYGEDVLGASPGLMAGLVVAAGAVGLPSLLAGRWAADHLGRRVTAGVATALMVAGAVITYSGAIPAMAAGYLLAVSSGAAFGPAAGALVTELFPTRDRSTAGGWTALAGVLGAVAGLAAFGALADALGSFTTAGLALWLPLLPFAGLVWFLPETRGTELEDLESETATG